MCGEFPFRFAIYIHFQTLQSNNNVRPPLFRRNFNQFCTNVYTCNSYKQYTWFGCVYSVWFYSLRLLFRILLILTAFLSRKSMQLVTCQCCGKFVNSQVHGNEEVNLCKQVNVLLLRGYGVRHQYIHTNCRSSLLITWISTLHRKKLIGKYTYIWSLFFSAGI